MPNTNVSIEDMKSCIQEWFAQEYTLHGVSMLYFELRMEIEKQHQFMLNLVSEQMHENGVLGGAEDA